MFGEEIVYLGMHALRIFMSIAKIKFLKLTNLGFCSWQLMWFLQLLRHSKLPR
jgi:hypothetical protein